MRERAHGGRGAGEEAGSQTGPTPSAETYVGLDPTTPRSQPKPKIKRQKSYRGWGQTAGTPERAAGATAGPEPTGHPTDSCFKAKHHNGQRPDSHVKDSEPSILETFPVEFTPQEDKNKQAHTETHYRMLQAYAEPHSAVPLSSAERLREPPTATQDHPLSSVRRVGGTPRRKPSNRPAEAEPLPGSKRSAVSQRQA